MADPDTSSTGGTAHAAPPKPTPTDRIMELSEKLREEAVGRARAETRLEMLGQQPGTHAHTASAHVAAPVATPDPQPAPTQAPQPAPQPKDPGPHRHESATLTELSEERAKAAEHELIDAKAKLGVTENERDVAVKTAEVADTFNSRLVDRIDEVARQNGRLEGVNEVLKEQLQGKLNQPTPEPTPAKTPAEVAVERARTRPQEVRRNRGWLGWLLAIVLITALLVTIMVLWGPQIGAKLREWSAATTTSVSASTIPNTSVVVTPPPVSDIVLNVSVFVPPSYPPEDSQECTLSDMIFVNGYCILLPEDQ